MISRLERDAKLGALEERADALQDGCKQFEQQAAAMKNKFWLENMKAIVAGCVVAAIVGGLFIGNFLWHHLHLHTHQDTRPRHPHLHLPHLQHPQLMLGVMPELMLGLMPEVMVQVMAVVMMAGHQTLLASTLQDGFKI